MKALEEKVKDFGEHLEWEIKDKKERIVQIEAEVFALEYALATYKEMVSKGLIPNPKDS